MRVELVGFSQGVSLANKDETTNYLDFQRQDGRMFRVPITDDALNSLMVEIYGGDLEPGVKSADAPEVSIPQEPDADVFGGDDDAPAPPFEEEQFPQSEDEIPPL